MQVHPPQTTRAYGRPRAFLRGVSPAASRDRDSGAATRRLRLRAAASGRKIGTQKNQNGRFDMQSKAEIDRALRQQAEAKEIPGVVAMAATANEVIYQGAFGKRDLSKDDPMTADSVFWIA